MTIQLDPHERALIDLIARTQNDLARVIKARRIELDFTQTDLGHRAGIYQSRICDLEKHGTNRLDYIVRAAHGLGIPLSSLISAVENRPQISSDFQFQDTLRWQAR